MCKESFRTVNLKVKLTSKNLNTNVVLVISAFNRHQNSRELISLQNARQF